MIYHKRHGKMGRLGNQLFQLASLMGFARKYNTYFLIPPWRYAKFFKNEIPQGSVRIIELELQEPQFHYTPEWWEVHRQDYQDKNVNINGWLQSENYWDNCIDDVKNMFQFNDDLVIKVKELYLAVLEKPCIAISIRRGDYVDNPNYELLPIKYYLMALLNNFPEFREKNNIIIFSDDPGYCKLHFDCLSNVYYATDLTDIEQLCLGTLCSDFIIANSTFSWWMAYLGEKQGSLIIHPNYLFDGDLKRYNQDHSFWPNRQGWIPLDHKIQKLNLKNVTFTIPVKFDSKDRKENTDLILKLLLEDFDTNIIIGEQGHTRFKYTQDQVLYVNFHDLNKFHRTKMLNEMANMSKTHIVVNYDCDVALPPLQLIESAMLIQEKKADVVYPYDGRFARVPRSKWYQSILSKVDIGLFGTTVFHGMRPEDAKSVGGCIMFNLESFLQGGMENEYFISYGPEDTERYERFIRLGFKVVRIDGVLYHFDHVSSLDSGVTHPNFAKNKAELDKERSMEISTLRTYVDSWPWSKSVYRPSYYESIVEESVQSRNVVFDILREWGIIKNKSTIVDFGCGLGSWGKDLDNYYYCGVDFGVPKDKLVIPKNEYVDMDLRSSPFMQLPPIYDENNICIAPKFDLAICLEVAEHLDEKFANQLVFNICGTSDTVLFSAAIPCQGGLDHVNEQWQSYWAEKFAHHGYIPYPIDIRDRIWNDERVGLWYRQNLILFQKDNSKIPNFGKPTYELNKVHPQMFTNILKHYKILK